MDKSLLYKILIIAIPTYAVAILTEAMVFTMPMLAITTLIATNLFNDGKEVENRVDQDGTNPDGSTDGMDGMDGRWYGYRWQRVNKINLKSI